MALLVSSAAARPSGLPVPVRWVVWLVAGVLLGVAAGFAVGLARPRVWRYGPYASTARSEAPSPG